MVKVIGYALFYGELTVGIAVTLYGLFLVGYKMYQKIREMILQRKIRKNMKNE